MRYYSTERPISIGTYPKPAGNKVLDIINYSEKTYCKEAGRACWGYIDYEKPLTKQEMDDYELVEAGGKDGDNEGRKITVLELDAILSPASPITYWQGGMPMQRRDIFDDCEVVSVELDTTYRSGRDVPCIAVYIGERA